jgi:hypothetical protein
VHSMAICAIEAGNAAAFREVTAGLELIELPLVAVPTHHQKPRSLGLACEFSRMSLQLIDLLWIATVAAIAGDVGFTVRARAMYPDDFCGHACGLDVAFHAVVGILFGTSGL